MLAGRKSIVKLKVNGRIIAFCVAVFVLCCNSAAHAADAATNLNEVIHGSVEPGRISQQVLAPESAPTAPPQGASIVPEKTPTLSPEAAKITFQLKNINIEGATIFTKQQLLAPFQKDLNKVVSLGDIEAIAAAMTARYVQAGYILTRVVIPPQQIANGIVTLRVVEGFVDKIQIQGDVWPNVRAALIKYGDNIRASNPLKIDKLERYALLVNDLPGINARLVLRPSKTTPGAADLVFVVQQHPINGYVSVDNRGTRFLGPQEITAGANMNSLFRAGDTTGVQLQNTFNKELEYFAMSHQEPLGTHGLKMTANASYTRSLPGSFLSIFEIKGESNAGNLDFSYPIIRARDQNLYIHGGPGILNSRNVILNFTLYNDHIPFIDVGASYDRWDKLVGQNQFSADFTKGLDVMGASNGVDISRPGVSPHFYKVNLNAQRLQYLPHGFSVLLASQGQYTQDPQYAAEQFGFGGPIYGRGYDPSEILGDQGIAAKAELRYDRWINEFYVFYDAGDVWNHKTIGQPGQQSATSTGIGIRTQLTTFLSGNFEVAQPLTRTVAAEQNKATRFYMGITLAGENTLNYAALPLPSRPLPLRLGTQNTASISNNQNIRKNAGNYPTAADDPTKLSFWQKLSPKVVFNRYPKKPNKSSSNHNYAMNRLQHSIPSPFKGEG